MSHKHDRHTDMFCWGKYCETKRQCCTSNCSECFMLHTKDDS